MKIYAIRDRMIDYFQTPFCAHDDKTVFAAMAHRLNVAIPGDNGDAIRQAPHHFEIWELGQVEENGHITAKLDFLADCSSLVRGGIRDTGTPGEDSTANAAAERQGSLPGDPGNGGTNGTAVRRSSYSAPGPAQKAYSGPGGSYPPPSS